MDEAGRLSGLEEPDLVDLAQDGLLLERKRDVRESGAGRRALPFRTYRVDSEEDVGGVGVVSDHPGPHLPLVVGHERRLAGGEADGADGPEALADEVGREDLDQAPVRDGRTLRLARASDCLEERTRASYLEDSRRTA